MELVTELQKRVDDGIERHRIPGASVAVFEGDVLETAASGVINVNTGVALTPDTVMHLGSITKVLTATLILQLVDEGRIELDAPALRYVPALRLGDPRALEQITVRMLLNHTSGIDGDGLPDAGHDEETIEKGIARLAGQGQIHPPGAEYSYCNAATALAGFIAQRVTGLGWYRLIRDRIFLPLGMEHAATLPEEALLHRAAVGHYIDDSPGGRIRRVSRVYLPFAMAPAGASLMTSASDLLTFARAHMADGMGPNGVRILSPESAALMRGISMLNTSKGYTFTDGIGLGWMVCTNGLLHHAGGGPGIVSVLYAHPQRRVAMALLTNGEFRLSWKFTREFSRQWLLETGIDPPPGMESVQAAPSGASIDPARYVGVYENSASCFSVGRADAGLTLSTGMKWQLYEYLPTGMTPPAPLVSLGNDRFLMPSGGEVFVFRNPGTDGRMRYLGNSDRLYLRTSA